MLTIFIQWVKNINPSLRFVFYRSSGMPHQWMPTLPKR